MIFFRVSHQGPHHIEQLREMRAIVEHAAADRSQAEQRDANASLTRHRPDDGWTLPDPRALRVPDARQIQPQCSFVGKAHRFRLHEGARAGLGSHIVRLREASRRAIACSQVRRIRLVESVDILEQNASRPQFRGQVERGQVGSPAAEERKAALGRLSEETRDDENRRRVEECFEPVDPNLRKLGIRTVARGGQPDVSRIGVSSGNTRPVKCRGELSGTGDLARRQQNGKSRRIGRLASGRYFLEQPVRHTLEGGDDCDDPPAPAIMAVDFGDGDRQRRRRSQNRTAEFQNDLDTWNRHAAPVSLSDMGADEKGHGRGRVRAGTRRKKTADDARETPL